MAIAMAVSIWLFANQTKYIGVVPKHTPAFGDLTFEVGFVLAAAAVRDLLQLQGSGRRPSSRKAPARCCGDRRSEPHAVYGAEEVDLLLGRRPRPRCVRPGSAAGDAPGPPRSTRVRGATQAQRVGLGRRVEDHQVGRAAVAQAVVLDAERRRRVDA